jgi:hypothetical protein
MDEAHGRTELITIDHRLTWYDTNGNERRITFRCDYLGNVALLVDERVFLWADKPQTAEHTALDLDRVASTASARMTQPVRWSG